MRKTKVRIDRGHVVDPLDLPEKVEGWLIWDVQEAEVAETPSDPWVGYDPKRVKEALRQSAGALRGVDREGLLRDIHLAREQDSRGRHE
jgi:hypothetical protein